MSGYNIGYNFSDIVLSMPSIQELDGKYNKRYSIKRVIFNEQATIVYWSDGTKTVVKCDYNEYFDKEKGLAMAISKKFFGNKGNYYNQFKKWI